MILRNWTYLAFRAVAGLALSFLSIRLLVDTLGQDDIGRYYLISAFLSFICLAHTALSSASKRFIYIFEQRDGGTPEVSFESILASHFCLGLLIAGLGAMLSGYLLRALGLDPDVNRGIFLVCLSLTFVTILLSPFSHAILRYGQTKVLYMLGMTDILARLSALACFYYLIPHTVFNWAVVAAASIFVVELTGAALLFATNGIKFDYRRLRVPDMVRLARYSSANLTGDVMSALVGPGTAATLGAVIGPQVNVAFVVANSLRDSLAVLAGTINNAVAPNLMRIASGTRKAAALELTSFSAKVLLVIISPVVVFFFSDTTLIVRMLVGADAAFAPFIAKAVLLLFLLDVATVPVMNFAHGAGVAIRAQFLASVTGIFCAVAGLLIAWLEGVIWPAIFGNILALSMALCLKIRVVAKAAGLDFSWYWKSVIARFSMIFVASIVFWHCTAQYRENNLGVLVLTFGATAIFICVAGFSVNEKRKVITLLGAVSTEFRQSFRTRM
jgi:O-antigen/teichoic acid export membrane protein